MSFDMDRYRDSFERQFGFKEQPWSQPLGALMLTLAGENVDLERARAEAEDLKYVLNRVAGLPVPVRN